jgi:hypothetical protein
VTSVAASWHDIFMDEVELLRSQLRHEQLTSLQIMEDVQDLIEVLSSEIPLHDPNRQIVEHYLPSLREAISSLRERLQISASSHPQ